MITYTWEFSTFETAPVEETLVQVVKVIHWRLHAEDGAVRTSIYGTVNLASPNPDDFVAFNELTKQWAIDAVSSVIDVPATEAALAAEIERQKNPPVVSVVPPFQN